MRHDGARAPLTVEPDKGRLVRPSASGVSKRVVTASLDHRRCERCGYEFTVQLSLTEVRRSLLVMERGKAFSPCRKCGSRKTVIVSTEAFPPKRPRERTVRHVRAGLHAAHSPSDAGSTLDAHNAQVYALLRELEELSLALADLIGAGLSAAQETAARDVLAAMQHVVAQAQHLGDPVSHHTGRYGSPNKRDLTEIRAGPGAAHRAASGRPAPRGMAARNY
jgi:hypothetical protein